MGVESKTLIVKTLRFCREVGSLVYGMAVFENGQLEAGVARRDSKKASTRLRISGADLDS